MGSNEKYDVPPPSYEEAANYKPVGESQIDPVNGSSSGQFQGKVKEEEVDVSQIDPLKEEEEIEKEKNGKVQNQAPLINNHTPIITTQPTPVATYTAVDGGGTTHIVDDSCCTACWCLTWYDSPSCFCCNCDDCCDGKNDCDCGNCCGDCGDCDCGDCECDCSGCDCNGCDCSGCDLGGCI